MIVPTFGLFGFRLAGDQAALTDPLRWLRWWSNTTAGVLLVGPMLVAVSRQSLGQFIEHWAEAGLWLLAVAICCAGALSFDNAGVGRPVLVMIALLLVVAGAIRFGLVVAACGALAIMVASGLSFAFGRGAFGGLVKFAGLATIWSFSAALTGVNLIVTALLAERDRAGLERLRAEHRYAQIFDGNPQPLWAHDPDTLAFLLVNEAAVRQYGWSREEFLTRGVPVLAPSITLELEVRNHLYRIAQEAVQNALKYAHARNIEIDLWVHARGVSLTINDDGVGMPRVVSPSSGLGMRTMHFRASSIGGRLVVADCSTGGVSITCEVAQPHAAAAIA